MKKPSPREIRMRSRIDFFANSYKPRRIVPATLNWIFAGYVFEAERPASL